MLYLATLGGNLTPVNLRVLPNTSPVTCCGVLPFSLTANYRCHISASRSQTSAAKCIQHCQYVPAASHHQMSTKALQPTICTPDVYLQAVSNDSAPEYCHHTGSPKTPAPILFLLCEPTVAGLNDRIGNLLQGVYGLHQAHWGFAFCTAQARWIITPIISIICLVGSPRQWREVRYSC